MQVSIVFATVAAVLAVTGSFESAEATYTPHRLSHSAYGRGYNSGSRGGYVDLADRQRLINKILADSSRTSAIPKSYSSLDSVNLPSSYSRSQEPQYSTAPRGARRSGAYQGFAASKQEPQYSTAPRGARRSGAAPEKKLPKYEAASSSSSSYDYNAGPSTMMKTEGKASNQNKMLNKKVVTGVVATAGGVAYWNRQKIKHLWNSHFGAKNATAPVDAKDASVTVDIKKVPVTPAAGNGTVLMIEPAAANATNTTADLDEKMKNKNVTINIEKVVEKQETPIVGVAA